MHWKFISLWIVVFLVGCSATTSAKPVRSHSVTAASSAAHPSSTASPATAADAILEADGYSVLKDVPGCGDINSAASGVNSNGTYEVVFVITPDGTALIPQLDEAMAPAADATGVTINGEGNVIRITGTKPEMKAFIADLGTIFPSSSGSC